MRYLLLALLLASADTAAETYLTVSVASYHAERHRDDGKGAYEQENLGFGLEHVLNDRWRLAAGIYRNSIRQDSGYVGVSYLPVEMWGARVGASVGMVSGYTGNLVPIFIPTVSLDGRFGFNLLVMPPYDKNPAGLGLQLKIRLP